jgi:hypothetical protein
MTATVVGAIVEPAVSGTELQGEKQWPARRQPSFYVTLYCQRGCKKGVVI